MKFKKIIVLGSGSFGTTLANILADKGVKPIIWSIEDSVCHDININHRNEKYIQGLDLHPDLKSSTDLMNMLPNSDLIVWAIPTQHVRSVLEQYSTLIKANNSYHVNVAKGLEVKSGKRISELMFEFGIDEQHYCLLAGPSHAEEIAFKMATAICSISANKELSKAVQELFKTAYFRVYTNNDLIGSEFAGAYKNVVAIAAGICDGFGLGDNAKAALMTRSLYELSLLVNQCGGQMETLSGLTGVGDLIATCCSKHSRNRHVGEELGKGKNLTDILNNMVMVAEGVKTCEAFYHIKNNLGLDMPIVDATYRVMFNQADVESTVLSLMTRSSKGEF